MRLHLHRGPVRERLSWGTAAAWDEDGRGVTRRVRVTERERICTRCRARIVTTTRDGRTWRRTYPAAEPAEETWFVPCGAPTRFGPCLLLSGHQDTARHLPPSGAPE